MSIERSFITSCKYINIMYRAVLKASNLLVKNFAEIKFVKDKTKYLEMTEKRITQIIYTELSMEYTYSMLYEDGPHIDDNIFWILDPIDGSRNFVDAIPLFTINLAIQKRNNIVAGIIYDPIRDEIYWASRHIGAYNNRTEISVSNQNNILVLKEHIKTNASIRALGCSGLELAYVASGKYSAFYSTKPNIWDIASGIILVQEAGGYILHNDQSLLCGDVDFCKSFMTNLSKSYNL